MECIKIRFRRFDEKVNSVILNGTSIGGCNPPGNDYDCDFYDCTDSFIRKVKADENGKINVKADYQGHSADCYCDQKAGKCISEKSLKPKAYESTFAAIKFNLYFCVEFRKNCKSITKIIYLNSQKNTLEGDILNLIPNKEYDFDWSVLRSDLGDSSEKVNSLTLNGTTIDGCNPPGNDYDCDFYDCTDSLIRKVKADKNGKINVKANYVKDIHLIVIAIKIGKCSVKKSQNLQDMYLHLQLLNLTSIFVIIKKNLQV